MREFMRRLRGAAGIAVTWGVLWALLGLALGAVVLVVKPEDVDPGEGPAKIALVLGFVGFLAGLSFAALLLLAERRRTLQELALARVALWGVLGASGIPLLTGADASMAFITGPLGALFATASVALARRHRLHQTEAPKLLE